MIRRRSIAPKPDRFDRRAEVSAHRRKLTPGVELSLVGITGRWRFVAEVTNPRTGETWLDVFGPLGTARAPRRRSVAPDRLRTVHDRRLHDRSETTTTPKGTDK